MAGAEPFLDAFQQSAVAIGPSPLRNKHQMGSMKSLSCHETYPYRSIRRGSHS